MKFNYYARNEDGEIRSGSVEAFSKETAISLLQGNGLFITFLEEAGTSPVFFKRISFFDNVSKKDVVLFSRHLSVLFESDVSLFESLRILADGVKNPVFKEKILKVSENVEGGVPFSDALSAFPKIFSPFYTAMVKSGEATGKMSESLTYLADYLEKAYYLEAKIKGAMIYPLMVCLVAVAVSLAMIFFVFPKLNDVFVESGVELPLATKVIMGSGQFLIHWWWALLLVIIVVVSVLIRYYNSAKGKDFFDAFFLNLPVIGPVLKMIYLARFAENLSTLIIGGIAIGQALEITGNIVGNNVYKDAILKSRDDVRGGEPISSFLIKSPALFPTIFSQMVSVGEKTGTLGKSLTHIVKFYSQEVDRSIDNLLGLLEPLMVVILGIGVAFILISVLMPLYQSMSGY